MALLPGVVQVSPLRRDKAYQRGKKINHIRFNIIKAERVSQLSYGVMLLLAYVRTTMVLTQLRSTVETGAAFCTVRKCLIYDFLQPECLSSESSQLHKVFRFCLFCTAVI